MAAFVDTNILLYAFSNVTEREIEKVVFAGRLIDRLVTDRKLLISAQVLSEFISVATRKGKPPLTTDEVKPVVDILTKQIVIPIDASLVQLALNRVDQSRISYWDALIVEAAIRSGATILYTEDMGHGTRYGSLTLQNPFLS